MVRVDISGVESKGNYKDVTRGIYVVESDDYSIFEHSESAQHPDSPFWSIHWRIDDESEFDGKYVFGRVAIPCLECIEAGGQAEGHGDKQYEMYDLVNILSATMGQHKFTKEALAAEIEVEPEDLLGLRCRVRYGKQSKNSDYMTIKKYMPEKSDDNGDSSLLP